MSDDSATTILNILQTFSENFELDNERSIEKLAHLGILTHIKSLLIHKDILK